MATLNNIRIKAIKRVHCLKGQHIYISLIFASVNMVYFGKFHIIECLIKIRDQINLSVI